MQTELIFLLIGVSIGLLIGIGLLLVVGRRPAPPQRDGRTRDEVTPTPDTTVQHAHDGETDNRHKLPERFVQATTSKLSLMPVTGHGSAPVAMLTAHGGPLDGQSFLVRYASSMTIGRFNDCDLAIPDSDVSRLHAQITHRTDAAPAHEFAIFDYSSTNGTILNNQPINAVASLNDGDLIAIGRNHFRFHRIRKGKE